MRYVVVRSFPSSAAMRGKPATRPRLRWHWRPSTALRLGSRGAPVLPEWRRGGAALEALGAGIWFPFRCTMLAEVLDLAGKTKGALQSLAEARTTMDQTQERWWEAEVYRLQGELQIGR